MKFALAVLITLGAAQSFAGDKIGNGGGLWTCRGHSADLRTAELVDLYEAREEFGLTLITPNPSKSAKDIFNERRDALARALPELAQELSPVVKEVEMKIRFVSAQLEIIEDALYRVRPLPQTCATSWTYEQFANYSHQGQVLIRKDLWEHAAVKPVDKAALLWHEIIYRHLRVRSNDLDSVRARQVVGLLFSTLPDFEMRSAINNVLRLDNSPPPPPTPPAALGWICTSYNRLNWVLHAGYGESKLEATAEAERSCSGGESTIHCHDLTCEKLTSPQNTHICVVKNRLNSTSHTGKGRNLLEAMFNSQKACQGDGSGFHCKDSSCEAI